jgi:hypothetical protein
MAPKQQEIPGTEAPKIKEIEEAAESYVAIRDKRMALTEKEIVAKANLVQVVQSHVKELDKNEDGEPCYRYDDLIVILKAGRPGVKVKHASDESEDDDD